MRHRKTYQPTATAVPCAENSSYSLHPSLPPFSALPSPPLLLAPYMCLILDMDVNLSTSYFASFEYYYNQVSLLRINAPS